MNKKFLFLTRMEWLFVFLVVAVLGYTLYPRYMTGQAQHSYQGCCTNLRNIGLALDLYASEHGGEYPSELTDLVPAYLPALPTCRAKGAGDYAKGYLVAEKGHLRTVCFLHGFGKYGPPECQARRQEFNELLMSQDSKEITALRCPTEGGPELSLSRLSFELYCPGHGHTEWVGSSYNYPRYNSENGLVEAVNTLETGSRGSKQKLAPSVD